MFENYLKDTAIHANGSHKSKTVTQNQNNLPSWMTLQTIISVVTLIGMLTGFFVQNAIQNERAERLKLDFEVYKAEQSKQFEKLQTSNEQIKLELSRQQGIREAQERKK